MKRRSTQRSKSKLAGRIISHRRGYVVRKELGSQFQLNLLRRLISNQNKRITELNQTLESRGNQSAELTQLRLEQQELQLLVKSQQTDIMNLQVTRIDLESFHSFPERNEVSH
jgi:hypothetical protein